METEDSIDLSSLSAGPFISGTSHAILRLGQPPVPGMEVNAPVRQGFLILLLLPSLYIL